MDAIISSFVYRPPASYVVNAMSVVSIVMLIYQGLSEVRGKHVRYSKFRDDGRSRDVCISSRAGMLLGYTPALAAALVSLAIPEVVAGNGGGSRGLLVSLALCLHFLKREFEIMFVHEYSGKMALGTAIHIMFSYLFSTTIMIYAQYLTKDAPEPVVDLKYAGAVLFLVGIAGNFYHHCLLAGLRKKGADNGYKIPTGGLFGLVACPHYLFEIVGFLGIAFMSQTLYMFSFTVGIVCYLMGRSYATLKWYASKFEEFPKDVKALIPYVF